MSLLVVASCAAAAQAAAAQAAAAERPTDEMMGLVRQLAAFMSTLPPGGHPPPFAVHGVCIIENFQPFLFCGPDAAERWETGFRAHSAEEGLSNLTAAFGDPWDFNRSESRAYFSLPTTWTGMTHGRPFEEHGAWAFVLAKEPGGWRIESYGWGVTSYVEARTGT